MRVRDPTKLPYKEMPELVVGVIHHGGLVNDKPTAEARVSQSGELYNVVHSIHCIYYVTLYNPVQHCTTLYIVTFPTFT